MRLNELEKVILIAERDYRAIDDKIKFVNLRMKYIRFDKANPTEPIISYKCKKLLIKKDTYYRKLGEMETKSKVRAQHIIRNLLPELINEHDMLIEDRKELHEMQADAKTRQAGAPGTPGAQPHHTQSSRKRVRRATTRQRGRRLQRV